MLLGDFHVAENHVHQALLAEPTPPLAAVVHLQVASRLDLPSPGLYALAEHYHERFPACQVPTLILASALIEGGDSEKGVSLLHQTAAQDVTGQVASRLWTSDHPFRALWPEQLEAPLELAIPAEIAVALGWNCLPEALVPTDTSVKASTEMPTQAIPKKPDPLQSLADTAPIPVHSETRPTNPIPLEVITIGITANKTVQPEAQPIHSKPVHSPYDIPETLRSVQFELEKVALSLKQNQLAALICASRCICCLPPARVCRNSMEWRDLRRLIKN
jgi:hypothetical protein